MPVDNPKREELYRQLASRYVETDGQKLKEELAELEQQGVSYVTPRLDKRVRELTGARSRKTILRAVALIAACFVLVLIIPRVLDRADSGLAAPQSAETAEMEEDVAEDEAVEEEATDEADIATDSVEEAAPEMAAAAYEVIPLAFALPQNFEVASVEQDNAQSIYFLRDLWQDDVVMTLEYTGEPLEVEGLTQLELAYGTAWAESNQDYSLLVFEAGGLRYTLTCRYDLNTLLPLAERAMAL